MQSVLCVANPIKEVLSGEECRQALLDGIAAAEGTGAYTGPEIRSFLMSDGGDGFLDAVEWEKDFERINVDTTDPLGAAIFAPSLWDKESATAYIELALCCGLGLVDPKRRNIMMSGTAGLADMVAGAHSQGAKEIYLGLGGSATCDGGVGFLWRLACLTGQYNPSACVPRVAIDLAESPSPDIAAIREWLGSVRLRVCVDVNNPLLGDNGAARVFAPQKGADAEQTEQLDAWMKLWCDRVERNAGEMIRDEPGAGAAGGLGFTLRALGAELLPGARTVAKLIGLSKAINPDSLLLTTEGKFDSTSFGGKAPWTAAQLALKAGGKAAIFCGIADDAAASKASDSGVRLIEYGRGMDPATLRRDTPARLSAAVRSYFENQQGAA